MKFTLFAFFFLLTASVTALGQRITVSSICSPETVQPADVVLTICTHEMGMTSFLQPKLDLRLFADGRAEYEVAPPADNYPNQTNFVMVVKQFNADPKALTAIRELGRQPDFQNAKASYPHYQAGMDVSIETTITFYSDGKAKSIKLVNASFRDTPEQKKLPVSLVKLQDKANLIREIAAGYERPIPKLTICDLVTARDFYFDSPVSVEADLEYNERDLYLYDPVCSEKSAAPQSERLAISYRPAVETDTQNWRFQMDPVRTDRFGGRARVSVIGMLRDDSKEPMRKYDYRLEITEFKSVERIVLPYRGELEPGWFYCDRIAHVSGKTLQLSVRPKLGRGRTAQIEWANEREYLAGESAGAQQIVFRVVSKTTERTGGNRWRDNYVCEVVELKPLP